MKYPLFSSISYIHFTLVCAIGTAITSKRILFHKRLLMIGTTMHSIGGSPAGKHTLTLGGIIRVIEVVCHRVIITHRKHTKESAIPTITKASGQFIGFSMNNLHLMMWLPPLVEGGREGILIYCGNMTGFEEGTPVPKGGLALGEGLGKILIQPCIHCIDCKLSTSPTMYM